MSHLIRWKPLVMALTAAALTSCGSADAGARTDAPDGTPASSTPTAHPPTTPPVAAPSGPVDVALAVSGEAAFAAKGCVACHYVGRDARLVGPDLSGVTERRTWPWFYAMVTNPDSMVKNDAEAKAMLGEYMTPMANQAVTDEEVQSIWEYLRRGPISGG